MSGLTDHGRGTPHSPALVIAYTSVYCSLENVGRNLTQVETTRANVLALSKCIIDDRLQLVSIYVSVGFVIKNINNVPRPGALLYLWRKRQEDEGQTGWQQVRFDFINIPAYNKTVVDRYPSER